MTKIPKITISNQRIRWRCMINRMMKVIFSLSTALALIVLLTLLIKIVQDAWGWLTPQFLSGNLSIRAERAGIRGVIRGSIGLMVIVIPFTLLVGVATAIYLEEYGKDGWFRHIVKVNISNLASIPSVIFGLLGLTVFGRFFHLGSSILAGGLTLSLLVLPIVVVSAQEAIKSVPNSLREASYGLGASKWTTIRKIVLPAALPGIMTGSILSISRAIGETAPLVVLGIPALIMKMPTSLMSDFTALPIQIYYWTIDSVLTKEYANLAASTIVVLLSILFILNTTAIIIRNKYQRVN